jgi:exoribonuclease-2
MMPTTPLPPNSLVLYKSRPGRISRIGPKKIEIVTDDGRRLSVRPKDVLLLHPGPLESLARLDRPDGDLETAWEILAGESTTIAELAELAFGEYTPGTAWSVWEAITDGLYFSGQPEEIKVHTPGEVAREQAAREAKEAGRKAWSEFVDRLAGGTFSPEDRPYLEDVAALALDRRTGSHVLDALDRTATLENAHALLLEIGYWDANNNPYLARAGVSTGEPELTTPALPDEERRDLTHLVTLAIDDAGTQDPDDAITLDGNRLWVHIADVAALVPAASPADINARSRGANLYLPEGTVTMLPKAATEQLGLGLHEVSPALSFGLDMNADGEVVELEIVPSWIKVRRLSYSEAEALLEEEPLRSLNRIARQYEARRTANGAININLPEVKIKVVEGQVAIRPLPGHQSRSLVREAMLLTGAAVGQYALDNGIAIPFTSQDAPVEEITGRANCLSEMFALRRRMKPGQQAISPGSHAGLGMDIYVQATSPLRRYLDLVVHQQLRAHLSGGQLLDSQELTERVGAAGAISGSVRWAERRSNEHWTLVYLLQNPDWQGEGIIVEKRGRRDVVLIPDLDLQTNMYQKRDLPLDSHVRLAIRDVNLPLLEAHFREVG